MVVLAFFCNTAGHHPLFFSCSLCFKKTLFVKFSRHRYKQAVYSCVNIWYFSQIQIDNLKLIIPLILLNEQFIALS